MKSKETAIALRKAYKKLGYEAECDLLIAYLQKSMLYEKRELALLSKTLSLKPLVDFIKERDVKDSHLRRKLAEDSILGLINLDVNADDARFIIEVYCRVFSWEITFDEPASDSSFKCLDVSYLAALIACEPNHYGNVFFHFYQNPDEAVNNIIAVVDEYFRLYFESPYQEPTKKSVTASKYLLTALMTYLYYEAPPEEQNMFMVTALLEAGDFSNEITFNGTTDLDRIFALLEEKDEKHIALEYYRKVKVTAYASFYTVTRSLLHSLRQYHIKPFINNYAGFINTGIVELEARAKACVSTIDNHVFVEDQIPEGEERLALENVFNAMEQLFLGFVHFVYFNDNADKFTANRYVISIYDFYSFIENSNSIDLNDFMKNDTKRYAAYFQKAKILFPEFSKTDYHMKLGFFQSLLIFLAGFNDSEQELGGLSFDKNLICELHKKLGAASVSKHEVLTTEEFRSILNQVITKFFSDLDNLYNDIVNCIKEKDLDVNAYIQELLEAFDEYFRNVSKILFKRYSEHFNDESDNDNLYDEITEKLGEVKIRFTALKQEIPAIVAGLKEKQ